MVVKQRVEVDKVEGERKLSWRVFIGWGLFGCEIPRFSLYLSYYYESYVWIKGKLKWHIHYYFLLYSCGFHV